MASGEATLSLNTLLIIGGLLMQAGMFIALTRNHLKHLSDAVAELKADFKKHQDRTEDRLSRVERKCAAFSHDPNGGS